ncbi:alkaline phosphatase [Micromonospora sp. HM5-17]|nr:alkaline phosphatase [Micromonospora sp. HM5-17]
MLAIGGGLAALAGLSQLTADRSEAAERIADYPFRLGVASGDPEPDGVVLWTRLAPDALAEDGRGGMPPRRYGVRWEVAEDEAMRRIVRSGIATATPELGHSVHVEVHGLRPGREYWYRFRAGGHDSPVGRTKTAPEPWSRSALSFAFASCQNFPNGHYVAYRHMAQQDLDLVLHLGDYIYEGGVDAKAGVRNMSLSPAHNAEILTLAQYRLRYSLYKSDPDLQAAHAAAPWAVTLDDHDVENNWAGERSTNGLSPENLLRRRAAAFRALYENQPLRASSLPRATDLRLYRTLRYGQLATFHVLDTRQYRDRQDLRRRTDPQRSLLGFEQERWLLDQLGRSTATWDVLAQQVMMMRRIGRPGAGFETLDEDAWDGYEASRDRLLRGLVERRVANPVVLTGDVHANFAGNLKKNFDDPDSATVGVELVGTSISSGGNGTDLDNTGRDYLAANPHLMFHNKQRGYVRCQVTAEQWRADFLVADRVSTADGTVTVRKSFVVQAGRPGLQEA